MATMARTNPGRQRGDVARANLVAGQPRQVSGFDRRRRRGESVYRFLEREPTTGESNGSCGVLPPTDDASQNDAGWLARIPRRVIVPYWRARTTRAETTREQRFLDLNGGTAHGFRCKEDSDGIALILPQADDAQVHCRWRVRRANPRLQMRPYISRSGRFRTALVANVGRSRRHRWTTAVQPRSRQPASRSIPTNPPREPRGSTTTIRKSTAQGPRIHRRGVPTKCSHWRIPSRKPSYTWLVSTHPADNSEQHHELPVEELMRSARPLPPYEEMVIDDLAENEGAAFLAAVKS